MFSTWLNQMILLDNVLTRSIEMVIGMMTIITCGATYCPLNPNEPVERLSVLVSDLDIDVLILHTQTKLKWNSKQDLKWYSAATVATIF
ncbi:unnamed protein product [Didymodactylos carnosus]|uniref:Uncharacterized protein n=1 Tax=Didymodactylos carnosus TaxID=1234261 RepID=A0A815EJC9_9BILA|nr:unnamed protein product [Didymodactylos carnosus]CAF1311168.1 unnamed protein product [Didymodactylos carnosus]CAF4068602.1 unnamed protein product [Didymodactylos carnosus]CAF4148790.1 unnamed protein product [Didymodactylos carnosus]